MSHRGKQDLLIIDIIILGIIAVVLLVILPVFTEMRLEAPAASSSQTSATAVKTEEN